MDLGMFQLEQKEWAARNFPHNSTHSSLLGIVEEVGELAHAHLKAEQGIRGTAEEHRAEAEDAIGDIMVYLAGYCNNNGYDLAECLEKTWGVVMSRDWQAGTLDGTPIKHTEDVLDGINAGWTETPRLLLGVVHSAAPNEVLIIDDPVDNTLPCREEVVAAWGDTQEAPTLLQQSIESQMRREGLD